MPPREEMQPERPGCTEEREQRIANEAIVDAYGPEEQAIGWYYYLEQRLYFRFGPPASPGG